MTEQERPRTVPYAVWAVAGITELQRMQLEQHGYHIVRTEDVEAARTEGRQQHDHDPDACDDCMAMVEEAMRD